MCLCVCVCVCITVLSQESMASLSCVVTSGPAPTAHSPPPCAETGHLGSCPSSSCGAHRRGAPSQTRPESAPTRSLLHLDSHSRNSESSRGRRPPYVSSLSRRVNLLTRYVAVGSAIAPAGRDAWGRSSRSGTPNRFWGCGSHPVEPCHYQRPPGHHCPPWKGGGPPLGNCWTPGSSDETCPSSSQRKAIQGIAVLDNQDLSLDQPPRGFAMTRLPRGAQRSLHRCATSHLLRGGHRGTCMPAGP